LRLAADLEYWAFAKGRALKAKYKKLFHSPDGVLDAAIRSAVGCPVIKKTRITNGESNEVYSADLADGNEVIVRISSKESSRFEAERWAIEQCAEIGVPVPRVIAVEAIGDKGNPLSVSIENKIPGVTLDEMAEGSLSDSDMAKLLREAGHLLSRINSIATSGFGELDQSGNGKYESVRQMLSQQELNRDHFIKVARSIDLDLHIVEKALSILYEHSENFPSTSPLLIHNDFAPKNVLISGNAVSGILDFECAEGGDPAREFAYWQFFVEERYPLRYLIEGYDNKSVFGEEFESRTRLWRLYTGLTNLDRFARRRYKRGVEHCKRRLAEEIKQVA
jgi:aminoglycoside phosphotransferase (APT) family kinase protein